MPRRATVTVQTGPKLKDGTRKYRAKYGRKVISRYADTPEEAMRLGLDALDQNPPDDEKLTVRQFYARWTKIPGPYTGQTNRSTPTNRHNAERASKFADDHGDKYIGEINRALARDWASENPSRAGSVRTMFNDALGDHLIAVNPFAGLKLPGMVNKTRKYIKPLTVGELQRLADATKWLNEEKWRVMFRSAIVFTAYTGLRLGELSGLRWSDVNLADGTVNVSRQWRSKDKEYGPLKGRKPGHPGREIALFPAAAIALTTVLDTFGTTFSKEAQDPELIFTTPRGRRLDARNHYYHWNVVRAVFLGSVTSKRRDELMGDSSAPLHWHDLRHFTASWLLDHQISPQDAALQLGHTDGGRLIQELYGHIYEENALARMKRAIDNGDR